MNEAEKQRLLEILPARINELQAKMRQQGILSDEEKISYHTCCLALAALHMRPVRLPYCSASAVCEIEAGYANGVNDCKEAIRHAGYPIAGDE